MADNAEQNSDRVAQFCAVTGVDSSRAKFYLESAAWNLQLALASFYEEKDAGPHREDSPTLDESPRTSPVPPGVPARSGRIAGIADLSKQEPDEEEGQAFYAGGSERSGQQVLGPGKKSVNFVGELFKAAKMHGAQVIDPGEGGPAGGGPRRQTFQGKGYRLGSAPEDTRVVEPVPGGGAQSPPVTTVALKMWRDGFSVDDGPLRQYDDPASRDFLQSIQKGEIPRELLQKAPGEVNLNMEDHRHEEYVPPRRTVKAFVGQGHRLGSVTPNVILRSGSKTGGEEAAKKAVPLDASRPSTNVQIRLADGTRLVATLNDTHTVQDIRNYILAEYGSEERRTTLRELEDEKASLKDANLLNAVVVQRLK